ncbi:hypothetical protein ACWKSP_19375 [Micromonosporaceae bacterium Da 78-11]
MPRLLDVVARLTDIPSGDAYEAGPTIYARRPWTPDSDALVLRGAACAGRRLPDTDHEYLLEVKLAREVVEVWSAWRDNTEPAAEQATLAVIYYGENDAYQPGNEPPVTALR